MNISSAQAAEVTLKALANAKRLQVLSLLAERELNVTGINRHIDLSQSALSQHLALLRKAGLVHTRRDGQTIFYSLDDDGHQVRNILTALGANQ